MLALWWQRTCEMQVWRRKGWMQVFVMWPKRGTGMNERHKRAEPRFGPCE